MKRQPFIQFGKSIIIVVVALFSARAVPAETITLNLHSSEVNQTAGRDGRILLGMEGFHTRGKPGAPLLPSRSLDIALPSDANLTTVNLDQDIITVDIIDTGCIEPAPPIGIQNPGGRAIYDWGAAKAHVDNGFDRSIYSADRFYPSCCVQRNETGQFRKWRFVRISFTPCQYNPVRQQLKIVRNLRIHINFERIPNPLKDLYLADSVVDDLAAERFVNFQEAIAWYPEPDASSRAEIWDYVIITSNEIENSSAKLDEFIQHKIRRGFSPVVITEDELDAVQAPPPNDKAEKIRQWLKNNYMEHSMEYVLLIGNPHPTSADVPMKSLYQVLMSNIIEKVPSDIYYSALNGAWDLNDDGMTGVYPEDWADGGVDLTPQVFVGRIPIYQRNTFES